MNKPILDKSMAITRGALPGSRKLMLGGVPFREVPLSGGEAPVRLYDTSGPYTDDTAIIDIEKGLAARRRDWILARGDVEEYVGRERKPERVRGVERLPLRALHRGRPPVRRRAHRLGRRRVHGVEAPAVHALEHDEVAAAVGDRDRDRDAGLLGQLGAQDGHV